jgi:hypothetical protein
LLQFRLFGKAEKTLYVIGNGFDIHHKMDTWYSSFGLFLQDERSELYDLLIQYLEMPELDREDEDTLWVTEWNEFERTLANLAFEDIIDENREHSASPASDDYHKDLGTIEVYVSETRDKLTDELFETFKDFINQVDYPRLNSSDKLKIKKEAKFFNFNYTDSLQEYYNIEDSKIKYIHNNAQSEDVLILGHGIDPASFVEDQPEMPSGLNDEEQQEWIDFQSDRFDISVEYGKTALREYYNKASKDTDTIIQENQLYFESLKNIKQVVIFGHSLASVDENYFFEIISKVDSNCKWFIFYRNESEIDSKINRMIELGLNKRKIHPFNVRWLTKKCKT